MGKRKITLIMSCIIVFALAGCADNPEKSVVREKNMDKMLEEAAKKGDKDSYDEVKKELEKHETYQTRLEDKKLKVVAEVDAKVEIPEVEELSVYRVSAKKIGQKLLDRICGTLTPDVIWYDGSKKDVRTKSVIAKEINDSQKMLEEEKRSGDPERLAEEYERGIADLEEEYKNAPDVCRLTDYPSDRKIQSIRNLYESDREDPFYKWLYELHGNGEVFYAVSGESAGDHHEMFMQNSENYGNCLRYKRTKGVYEAPGYVYHADVESDIPVLVPKREGEEPDFSEVGVAEIEDAISVQCADNEPLTLTEEEAKEKVDALLGELGLNDYQCYEKGVYSQLLGKNGEKMVYRDVYRFLCLRKLDGVFVDNQAGFKLTDEWQGNNYVKKMWGSEAVAITVNDSGIVDFYYLSPLSAGEKVVEKSHIKSFSEIKKTFEKMVLIKNAPYDKGDQNVSIKVTEVKLVYTRISEKDHFDTGLIVPVWDFEGTVINERGDEETGNILSINAIDGSVIDQELGY